MVTRSFSYSIVKERGEPASAQLASDIQNKTENTLSA